MIGYARKKDKITYGHAGVGSASHLCALILMKELGVQMEGVAYRGTGPAMNDLIGGQFDVMCDQTTDTTNQIKDGKIKGYAVTTKFKVSSVPDLPTLDSTALPGFEVSAWHAMWAPKGLAQTGVRQTRGRAAGRAQRRESDRALRQPRHRAGCACARNSRCPEIAAHRRGEAVGRRHQGGRRQRQLSLHFSHRCTCPLSGVKRT